MVSFDISNTWVELLLLSDQVQHLHITATFKGDVKGFRGAGGVFLSVEQSDDTETFNAEPTSHFLVSPVFE